MYLFLSLYLYVFRLLFALMMNQCSNRIKVIYLPQLNSTKHQGHHHDMNIFFIPYYYFSTWSAKQACKDVKLSRKRYSNNNTLVLLGVYLQKSKWWACWRWSRRVHCIQISTILRTRRTKLQKYVHDQSLRTKNWCIHFAICHCNEKAVFMSYISILINQPASSNNHKKYSLCLDQSGQPKQKSTYARDCLRRFNWELLIFSRERCHIKTYLASSWCPLQSTYG